VHVIVLLALVPAEQAAPAAPRQDEVLEVALVRGFTASSGAASEPSFDLPREPEPQLNPVRRAALSDLWGPASPTPPAGGSGRVGALGISGGSVGDPGALVSLPRADLGQLMSGGKLAPCWRAPARPIGVTVTLVLDARGGVIGAPRITGAGGSAASGEALTLAEQALAGCAPYGVAAQPGLYETMILDFSSPTVLARPGSPVRMR
jgi:hypothetical protein